MYLSPIVEMKHPWHRLGLALRRHRARRRLNRDLTGFTNRELAGLLAKAGIKRSDLFTGFKSNRRHRRLMGEMLARFGIDRETACMDRWDEVSYAERTCAQCPNAGKCRRWLAWGRNNDAPYVFCRNAGLFTQLRLNLGPPRQD